MSRIWYGTRQRGATRVKTWRGGDCRMVGGRQKATTIGHFHDSQGEAFNRGLPMKKISSSMTARATIGALFFVIGVFLVVFAFFATGLRSATPSAGTLSPGGPTVNWAGTAAGGGSLDESTCVEGVNCDTFMLTLSGTPTNWSGLKARIVCSAAEPSGATDYDL